jgi:hypothetical protein
MRTKTPLIHWHGRAPIYSVDFHVSGRIVTGGGEPDGGGGVKVRSRTPCLLLSAFARGRERTQLWRCNSGNRHGASTPNGDPMDVEFVADLQGHARTVNAVRFAPTGTL